MTSPEKSAPHLGIVSLGCAKNTVDSETALGELLTNGYELTLDLVDADLVLINTCGFIEDARAESLDTLREILDLKGASGLPKVVAMGCLSERTGTALLEQLPGLDGVFGLGTQNELAHLCERVLRGEQVVALPSEGGGEKQKAYPIPEGPRLLLTGDSYAYLRITEGCSNRCAYCAIPSIRGPLRSRPKEHIVSEANDLVSMGIKELVLVGQDTTAYGMDLRDGSCLPALLRELLSKTDVQRIRVLYAHPRHIERELMAILANEERVCGYLDLPLQHVNSSVLRRMNRGYDRARVEDVVGQLRLTVPDIVLRTSLIVGFPGEGEDEFGELLEFVEQGLFQHLGVFEYSPEQGTLAIDLDGKVDTSLSRQRRELVLAVQQKVAFDWLDGRVGTEADVLVDRQISPDSWEGRSEAEAPDVDGIIRLKGTDFCVGAIFRTCLRSRDDYDVWAVSAADAGA